MPKFLVALLNCREEDRNAKLEKMRALEHQIMADRSKPDPQAQTKWNLLLQEHEAQKMGYSQSMVQQQQHHYAANQTMMPPPNFSSPSHTGPQILPAFQRPAYPQMPLHISSNSGTVNGIIPTMPGPSISQPLRPSLNLTAYGQYPSDSFHCVPPYSNAYFPVPPQGCPPELQQNMPGSYGHMFGPPNGAPMHNRGLVFILFVN